MGMFWPMGILLIQPQPTATREISKVLKLLSAAPFHPLALLLPLESRGWIRAGPAAAYSSTSANWTPENPGHFSGERLDSDTSMARNRKSGLHAELGWSHFFRGSIKRIRRGKKRARFYTLEISRAAQRAWVL